MSELWKDKIWLKHETNKRVISYNCSKENWMEQQKLTETWFIIWVIKLLWHELII